MRALWVLHGLLIRGRLRKTFGGLSRPRNLLLFGAGTLLFGGQFVGMLVMGSTARLRIDTELLRAYIPLAMFGSLLLSIFAALKSPGFTFQPAEIEFLFPAPVSRRALVVYRLISENTPLVFVSIFMGAMARGFSGSFVGAFVGVLFFFLLNNLWLRVAGLLSASMGERLAGRVVVGLLLAIIVGASAIAVVHFAMELGLSQWHAILLSDAMRITLAPFVVVTEIMLASTWGALAAWTSLASIITGLAVWILVRLDVDHREASIESSRRVQERLTRMKGASGMGAVLRGRVGRSLPTFPSWGGIGAIAWRQAMSFVREFRGFLTFLLILLVPFALGVAFVESFRAKLAAEMLAPIAGMVTMMGIMLLRFDFRGDYERMETLKQLPLSPLRLTIGQLIVPVAAVTLLDWGLGGIAVTLRPDLWSKLLAAAICVPFGVAIAIALENLGFLVYPVRFATGTAIDFQNIGRHMLLRIGEFMALGAVAAAAGGVGALAWWISNERLAVAIAAACTVMAIVLAAVVALVAWAFKRFDVAKDVAV